MKINEATLKYIVVGFLLTILFGIYIVSYYGEKQDLKFAEEHSLFNSAINSLQEGKLEEGLNLLNKVDSQMNSSYLVKYYKALTLFSLNQNNQATNEFQQVINLNPYIIEDPSFMLFYGRSLVQAGKTNEALIVLEVCQTLPSPLEMPDYHEQVNALITQLTENS